MALLLLIIIFIGLGVGLTTFFIKEDKGEREPIGALWIAVGFGLLGALVSGFVETKFIPSKDLMAGSPLGSILVGTLSVGFIEELCKFLPLALFIYKKRYFNEHTDGIIYFALAGLGFGVPENILYTIGFGTRAGITRLVLTPFFHAAVTGMVGYYLAKNKLAGKSVFKVIPVLILAMVLHGLYDFGLTSGVVIYGLISLAITLGVTTNLFNLFLRAGDLDQQQGLSVVGHNSFCRNCGFKNPDNLLYCTRCGKHA